MTISKILELLPVPSDAVEEKDHNWAPIYSKLGTVLPQDYIEFLSIYGSGSIGDFLWVMNPHSQNRSLNLEQMQYFRDAYRVLRSDHPLYYPRKPDDFLPWAFTDNGDVVFWLKEGAKPDQWLVGIQAADPTQEEQTDFTTSEFLEALLEKRLASSILPSQFLEADKEFTPL